MARGRSRRGGGEYGEFWPAYVDVLSTLLLVVTFLMSIFMISQYFATQEASGKETALARLLERLKDPSAEPQTTVLEAQVLPRGSTAAPRAL